MFQILVNLMSTKNKFISNIMFKLMHFYLWLRDEFLCIRIKGKITDTFTGDAENISTLQYIKENNMQELKICKSRKELLKYALSKVEIDGLYCEFGVFSGYTINHIANLVQDKTIYGFDSFRGLPENWYSGHPQGTFATTNLPPVRKNVSLEQGWFEDSLPPFVEKHPEPCAFLHIDSDLYSSAKTILDVFKSQIKAGTVIIFDEYFNYPDWEDGEFKAFEEFLTQTGLKYNYLGYVINREQVAVYITK